MPISKINKIKLDSTVIGEFTADNNELIFTSESATVTAYDTGYDIGVAYQLPDNTYIYQRL